MRHDEQATHFSPEPRDDRPLVADQDPRTKRWRVMRQDRGSEWGGQFIATDLPSREVAHEHLERERTEIPRTDSSRRASTRRTFYGFNIPKGGLK